MAGHRLQRIGEWPLGFRSAGYCRDGSYRWLDSAHLLLFPYIRQGGQDPFFTEITQPAVVGLSDTPNWLIGSPQESCELPLWSDSLQRLVEATSGEVRLCNMAGEKTAAYAGQAPLHLSPSGRRFLAGAEWIDLDSGSVVALPEWPPPSPHVPAWSADERRIFACCFFYADVSSGQQWARGVFPGFTLTGRGSGAGEDTWSVSYWLPGETRVMVQPNAVFFINPDTQRLVVPVFDPVAQTDTDLAAGLSLETSLCRTQLAPDGAHLWLACYEDIGSRTLPRDPAYLIALPALQARPMSGRLEFQGWSFDSRFLAYNQLVESSVATGSAWVLPTDGEPRQVADRPARAAAWHPTQPDVALRFDDAHAIRFFDARRGLSRDLSMQQTITDVVWQPTGPGAAIVTEDGELWWLADAFDGAATPTPLTPALPDIHTVRWSPDGRSLAFVSQTSLYVVAIGT